MRVIRIPTIHSHFNSGLEVRPPNPRAINTERMRTKIRINHTKSQRAVVRKGTGMSPETGSRPFIEELRTN
ncbi:hypothetical protein HanIR_Chr03g0101521 [Helianthus annuus]|nr:hypothetical protein HanIR_Chr03g0101521 [Helianthus annuus]